MTTIYQRKESALEWLAYASLKHWGDNTDLENISAEKARIERVAERDYKSAPDQEYNQFIMDWIRRNGRDLVYTDRFTYDVDFPEEIYETNLEIYTRRQIEF